MDARIEAIECTGWPGGLTRSLGLLLLLAGVAACGDDDAGPCQTSADCDPGAICDEGLCGEAPDAAQLDGGQSTEDAGPGDPDGGALDAGPPSDGGPIDAGPAPAIDPRITRMETLATDAQASGSPSGSPGNGWGGHQSRIVRLSTGQLYAAYMHSPSGISDPSDAEWVLMGRGPAEGASWTEVGRERAGREPMHLLVGPDDVAHLLSWPGQPHHWRVQDGAIQPGTAIPGGWETLTGSSTPYSGASIATDGRICFAAARGNVGPGTYTSNSAWDIACRSASGTWTPLQTLAIGERYCYPYLHVAGASAVDLLGTRDIRWEVAGYDAPPGGSTYVFDAVDVWRFASATDGSPDRSMLGEAVREDPVDNSPRYWQSDSLVDSRGQLHVLVSSRRTTGAYQLRHILVRPGGAVVEEPIDIGSYTDGNVRLIEDPWGRFFVLFFQRDDQYVFSTTDADGMVLGPRIELTSALTDGTSASGAAYITSPRGGTTTSGTVDLIYGVGSGTTVRYARLELHAP